MGRIRCPDHGLSAMRHLCPHLAAQHEAGRIRGRMRDVFCSTLCDGCIDAHGLTDHVVAPVGYWMELSDDNPSLLALESIPLSSCCARCVAERR